LLRNAIMDCRVYVDVDPETPVMFYENLPPIDFRIEKLEFRRILTVSPGEGSSIPPSPLSEPMIRRLSGLAKLRELHFAQLSGPSFAGFAGFKQLQSLTIDDTDATDDSLKALSGLTGLTTLRVRSRFITDGGLKHLAPLGDLAVLELNGHAKDLHGRGLEELGHLKKLKKLDLTGSGIDDDALVYIGRIPQLERLNLSETWITGSGLARLANLEHLRALHLSLCRRLAAGTLGALAKCHALEELDLFRCRIDDAAVESLAKLTSLRDLELTDTHVTQSGFNKISQSFPELTPAVSAHGTMFSSMHLVDDARIRAKSDVAAQQPARPSAETERPTDGARQPRRFRSR